MMASVGQDVSGEDREALILEVHGGDGARPYRVRRSDGHESVFFPSSGTVVEYRPSGSKQGSWPP